MRYYSVFTPAYAIFDESGTVIAVTQHEEVAMYLSKCVNLIKKMLGIGEFVCYMEIKEEMLE